MNAKCIISVAPIYESNSKESTMLSQILFGETCQVLATEGHFVKIKTEYDGIEGWTNILNLQETSNDNPKYILKKTIYQKDGILISIGSEIDENLEDSISFEQLLSVCKHIPYIKGGRSFFGVDADGWVQLVFKIMNQTMPRFAHQQAELGVILDFLGESEMGDLAFFENENGEINHVGIMLNSYEVMHAFGKVRIDALDSLGIYNEELKMHTHKLRFIKRILI